MVFFSHLPLLQRLGLEFLGTMLLSFVVVATGQYLAIGVALAAAVWAAGAMSGGAFNPAMTFVLYLGNQLSVGDVALYIVVEVLGAVAGLWLARTLKNNNNKS
jgi:glycerol uptake facilitator-like aquaporin